MNNATFSGKVAIVTGAGKGIGQACAIAFASMGAKVVLNGRSRQPLEESLVMIEKSGGKAVILEGDVANADVQKETVLLAVKEFGRVDFAVNNAGISPWVGNTTDCSLEDWQRVLNTNLNGTW